MKILLFILIFLKLESGNAYEEATYCFSSDINISRVENDLKQILITNEKIVKTFSNKLNCLKIKNAGASKEIIRKFIEKKFKITTINYLESSSHLSSNDNLLKGTCHIMFFTPTPVNLKKIRWIYLPVKTFKRINFSNSWLNLSCSNKNDKVVLTFKYKNEKKEVAYQLKNWEQINLIDILKSLTIFKFSNIENFAFAAQQ
jgi:hypothetical protein